MPHPPPSRSRLVIYAHTPPRGTPHVHHRRARTAASRPCAPRTNTAVAYYLVVAHTSSPHTCHRHTRTSVTHTHRCASAIAACVQPRHAYNALCSRHRHPRPPPQTHRCRTQPPSHTSSPHIHQCQARAALGTRHHRARASPRKHRRACTFATRASHARRRYACAAETTHLHHGRTATTRTLPPVVH